MNAVEILDKIENYFDRNHNLLLRFGGLFCLVFFTMYVPYNMVKTVKGGLEDRLQAQQTANVLLQSELESLNRKVEFANLSYEKKQAMLKEVECLARNIYFEAAGEPKRGKIAVAEVTMNRVRSDDFPKTVCGVVHQRTRGTCQFSWVCEGKKNPYKRSDAWQESLNIAENILIFKHEYGIIGTAMYFHADYVEPTWAERKKLIRKIGNHIFYH